MNSKQIEFDIFKIKYKHSTLSISHLFVNREYIKRTYRKRKHFYNVVVQINIIIKNKRKF